jgi:zinc/manganese transport system substrate-binding protein
MNIDPHSYEATALDSLRILHSDVFVENGLGYDSFADRILSTQKYNGRIIKVSDYLKNSSNINPHLWFNYPVVLDFAIDLTKLYANLLPSQTNYFNVQLSKFELGMKEIDRNISKISKADNNQSVAYTERVPGYIIAAAGLKNLTPVGFSNSVENGDNVAPADYLAMKELILNKEIKILFYNEQTISAITSEVKSLAVNSGISIFGITETMPNSFPNYLIWNQFLWNQLQKDLGN